MFCRPQPVWHGDGSVVEVIIRAVEVVIDVKIRLIVDDIPRAGGYRPIIVSKVRDGWARVGN